MERALALQRQSTIWQSGPSAHSINAAHPFLGKQRITSIKGFYARIIGMNIIEQRYDFLVDMRSLPYLDDVMFERLLNKSYRHKGWLYNYLFGTLSLDDFSANQQEILRRCAYRFYGRELT